MNEYQPTDRFYMAPLTDLFGRKPRTFNEVYDAVVAVRKEKAGEPDWRDPAQREKFKGIDYREAAYTAFRMLANEGRGSGVNTDPLSWHMSLARNACIDDIQGLLEIKGGAETTHKRAKAIQDAIDRKIDELVPVRKK